MKTRSEKLIAKIGQKTLCDGCDKKKIFTSSWMMDIDRLIYCPECLKTIRKPVTSI